MPGRSDSLYLLPEFHGESNNLKLEVPPAEIDYVAQHVFDTENDNEQNDYQEYFHYVRESLSIQLPQTWQEALALYRTAGLSAAFFVVTE